MPPSAPELLAWLASLPPDARDGALEERLGIAAPGVSSAPPGEHLIGYHASGVAPIVRALMAVPVGAADVLVDLGSGLGKVVLLARLLTGARAYGVELQPAFVERARRAAARLEVHAAFVEGDAREVSLDDGTVFFLYLPFTGPVLRAVVDRLRKIAERQAIVVCALGVDLPPAPWLALRPIDAFWLSIYDSVVPGVEPRAAVSPRVEGDAAEKIACGRA